MEFLKKVRATINVVGGVILLGMMVLLDMGFSYPIPIVFLIMGTPVVFSLFWGRARIGWIVYLSLIVFLVVSHQVRYHVTRWTGEKIIAALEQYHADKKAYPKGLKDLVPTYLEKVPRAWIGLYDFYYVIPKKKPDSYEIGFWKYFPILCIYRPAKKDWQCDKD